LKFSAARKHLISVGRACGWSAVSALVLALSLLLTACSGSGGATGVGNPRVSTDSSSGQGDSSAKPSSQTPGSGSPAVEPATSDGTLTSSDLALVYRLILDRYVDRVDHAERVKVASSAIRELELKSSVLPLESAALDFAPAPVGNPERDWINFSRSYDVVVQRNPRWAAAARPDWAAVRQMLQSLGDNHSMFIEPEEFRRMNETGYSGIGVRFSKPSEQEAPIVVEVFQGSPASRAGLKPGDRIVAVDGRPTEHRPLTEVASSIRGERGSPVKLSVSRGGQPAAENQITRAPVEVQPVQGEIRGSVIGVLRIRSFGEGVPEMVQRFLTQGRSQGARAWVLDLRGNPGGDLRAVARVAANFIENRPVGVAVDRSGSRTPINAEGRPAIPPAPIVVLVDRETSSGAEILASAIQEYQIGPIVGTTTSGSVGIASSQQLSDGSAIQLTISRLVSPSGQQLDKVGVEPDVSIDVTIADLERGQDPQLLRALELLLGRIQ
jgi:carboxyl-terminal processing protease